MSDGNIDGRSDNKPNKKCPEPTSKTGKENNRKNKHLRLTEFKISHVWFRPVKTKAKTGRCLLDYVVISAVRPHKAGPWSKMYPQLVTHSLNILHKFH